MSNFCFYDQGQLITFDTFCQHVFQARAAIKKVTANKVLLFDADSYQFSVWLFALIFEKKQVLLPPNAQVGTLAELASQCDASAGSISLVDKTQISYTVNNGHNIDDAAQLTRQQLLQLFSGEITFYTSGSTGKAKAINKSCQHLLLEVATLQTEFSKHFKASTFLVSTVSHQHIYGLLFKVLLPLLSGKVIVNQTFEYPEHIALVLNELSLSNPLASTNTGILVSSPAHLQRLAQDNVLAPYSQRFSAIFSSGGLLSQATSQALHQQMQIAPTEVYGSTETGGIAWRCGQNSEDEPWHVFDNISMQVATDSQRLAIFSPYVAQQPYLTDDRIVLLDTKRFLLKGRVDRTVKIEEKRVNLNQIERQLVAHSWVLDARVIVLNNKPSGLRRILAAVVVLTPVGQQQLADQTKLALNNAFKQYLLNDVERICLPKKWRYLAEFPYNSQGKLVLSDLEKLFD